MMRTKGRNESTPGGIAAARKIVNVNTQSFFGAAVKDFACAPLASIISGKAPG
jgi:hypothetical protein